MDLRVSSKNGKGLLTSLLLLASSVLTSFFVVSFVRTAINYRLTSADYSQLGDDLMPNLGPVSVVAVVAGAAVLFAVFQLARRGLFSRPLSFLYRHRVAVGACVVALATLFELSGSSTAIMSAFLGDGGAQGTLLGIPRSIRSDEWLVFTPFAFSQGSTGYAAVSDLLRGTATNVNLVYAQPCWDFSTLFRPFLWGYLVFGSTRGLAFFWSSRLVCLFLVSEAFAQMLFGKSRKVSVAFALMVTFAGTVQWWFAVNGTAELFIFGQSLVLCLDGLLGEKACDKRRSLLLSMAIAWLCVAFVFILYPAWQVILFWVFAALGIARVCGFVQAGHGAKEVLQRLKPLILSVVLAGAAAAACLLPVMDVVQAVSNTVYPGNRVNNGGELDLAQLGDWARALFSPLAASAQSSYAYTSAFSTNVCESAAFFALAPLGCVVALVTCVRSRAEKRSLDPVLCALCVVELVFLVYSVVGLPGPLASITLLSHSTSTRCWEMVGYVDLILLVRSAVVLRAQAPCAEADDKRQGKLVAIVVALAALCLAASLAAENVRLLFVVGAAAAMFVLLASVVLMRRAAADAELCLLSVAVLVAVSGACVNPLQTGAYTLTDGATATAISQANGDADLWLADNSTLGDLCVAQGASCINSVNTYPTLDTWHKIDPNGEYEQVYNRYAHITVEATDGETTFELTAPDAFKLKINLDDARKLGVTKWVTSDDLSSYETDAVSAVEVADAGSYKIWELVDKG